MPGFVKGRADQVIHRRVGDHETTAGALLDVDDAGQQQTAVAHQVASGLDHQRHAQIAQGALDQGRVVFRRGQFLALVGNAQAAAQVQVLQRIALGPERGEQLGDAAVGGFEGRQLGQLRADMDGKTFQLDAGQRLGQIHHRRGLVNVDAEFVVGLAGGDFGVSARVDMGVDAQHHGRRLAARHRDGAQRLQLLRRFHVELLDVLVESEIQFLLGLSNAGEHNLARRDACRQSPAQFAF